MARTTKGAGGASYTLGLLVIFAILFVIAVCLVILQSTNLTKMDKERQQAIDERNQYITKPEISSAEAQEVLHRADTVGTLFRRQQDEIENYKLLIVGVRNAAKANIDSEMANLDIDPKANKYLIKEIQSLRAQQQASTQAVVDLTKKRQDAEQKASNALQDLQTSEQTRVKLIDELHNNLTDLQEKFKAYQKEVDAHNTEAEAQIQQIRVESKKSLDEAATKISTLQQQNDNLKEQIRKVTGNRTANKGLTTHPELYPKGKILSIIKDDRLVYIDRGRLERVVLGLTFEVYDKITGVVADPHDKDNLHGKATIEVVSIGEHSSVCRIVRTEPGMSLVEGDVIANVVYDPNQQYKFVVFGEFDIDNSGQATVSDRRRIETMVTSWGGVLTDNLSYDTDFVVLGKEPALPDPLPAGTVDPDLIARHAAQLKKYELYQNYAKSARDQGIPVLNQNRFLSLVGYYHR